MRRTRSRRKIDLENDVIASPSGALINNGTPRNNVMRRRSMGTPSLPYIPNTPSYVDSPNRTLNETFSPEPEEKVFFQTLVDSVKKRKRHTSSALSEANVYDTPRITRATLNSEKKSRTSIKKAHKSSPDFANLEKIVSKTPKTMFLHTVGEVADFVAGDAKVIKSIRKTKRSSSVNDTLVSEKKNVKFHSPANMEVSTFDIDVKMQSDRKVMKRLRSFSNAETDKDKIKKTVTPERVEKTKTPRSRKKMPNFVEIHQRNFERMESITEHAARKAERAKILIRSPKITPKTETLHVEERKTLVMPEPEPKVLLDSKVMFKEEPETKVTQELESEVLPEPVLVIDQESEIKTETSEPNLFQEQQPLEMEKLDNLTLQIGSPSISTSQVLRSPFVFGETSPELQISKPDFSFLTESGQRPETNIVGRSPFAVQVLKSFSIPPKSPAMNKRPKALSRIPGKIKTADKNQTMQPSLPKTPKQDLNATVSRIPLPKSSSSVLTLSNKINAASTKNDVFVFQANKTALKPVNPVKPNLKRTKSMVSIKPRQPIPMRPAKENLVDKVKERQQKNMSMYKGRPDPVVKSRPAASKNMIAVRTNKRFELQMKFRQMNANN